MFKIFNKKEKEPQSIEDVLLLLKKLKQENKKIKEELKSIKKEIEGIKEENRFFVKKVEVARYNPFSGIGGNQSFSVVFLDEHNNGAVVTGLFTGEGSRVYAKQIEQGKSKYSLSKEEENLLLKVVNNEKQK